mgnify:CR=1 FL=1
MTWQQIICFLTSAGAIGLVLTNAPRSTWNRIGCAIGLFGQPFWLYENMRAAQFGMFAIGLWFLGWYAFGLIRPNAPASRDPQMIDLTKTPL